MAKKEIKITVPEGYEIDKENSTFECIKFKQKALSYKDIEAHAAKQKARGLFRAVIKNESTHSDIISYTTLDTGYCYPEHLHHLIALNKLMNVARHLNETTLDWDDDHQVKWHIYYDNEEGVLGFTCYGHVQSSNAYFDSEEHAKQAIEILGEDTIKCALGVI